MRQDKQLLALYGLKFNPFSSDIPADALWLPPAADLFLSRVEGLTAAGGFALLTGEPGCGKSKLLQLIDRRLQTVPDLLVGVMQRPQSSLSDLYRELGDLFGLRLAPANRYGCFKALRERWVEHCRTSLCRPVLLVDEAQQCPNDCLTELRLLSAARFDTAALLTVILCGDTRLPERFRQLDLVPLGSRIRTRLTLEALPSQALLAFLEHLLDAAGAPHLMSAALKNALSEHAAGNLRVLSHMGAELLAHGAQMSLPQLDEKLFLSLYAQRQSPRRGRTPVQEGAA